MGIEIYFFVLIVGIFSCYTFMYVQQTSTRYLKLVTQTKENLGSSTAIIFVGKAVIQSACSVLMLFTVGIIVFYPPLWWIIIIFAIVWLSSLYYGRLFANRFVDRKIIEK